MTGPASCLTNAFVFFPRQWQVCCWTFDAWWRGGTRFVRGRHYLFQWHCGIHHNVGGKHTAPGDWWVLNLAPPMCSALFVHFCQSLTLSLFVFIFDGFIFIGYLGRPSTPERLAPAVCHCALHNERLSDSDCHSNRFFAFRFVFRLAGGEFPQWSVHALRLHHSRLRCLQGGNDRRRIYGGRLTSTIHFIIAAQYHSANLSNANVPILLFNFEGQTEISS